jgi:hypothetical protein
MRKRQRVHTLRQLQSITHRGSCGKAPVMPHNRRPRAETGTGRHGRSQKPAMPGGRTGGVPTQRRA